MDASLYPYPSQIIIPDRTAASALAHKVSALGHVPRTLVIWCDGSALPFTTLPCAGAISYIHPETLQPTSFASISHLSGSQDAELLAIRTALDQAASLMDHFDKLILFSDAVNALRSVLEVSKRYRCRSVVEDISIFANHFYNEGIDVELHWVPKDAKVKEHKLVDQLAKAYRKIAGLVTPKELLEYDVAIAPVTTMVRSDAGVVEEVRDALREAVDAALITSSRVGRKIAPILEAKKERRQQRDKEKRKKQEKGEGEGEGNEEPSPV